MTSRVEIFPPGTRIPGESATEFLSGLTSRMSHEERLAQVRWLARVMDDRFAVPGTPIRFGWDSILGLFPGLGDALTSLISLADRASRLADRRLDPHARAHARQCRRRFPDRLIPFLAIFSICLQGQPEKRAAARAAS